MTRNSIFKIAALVLLVIVLVYFFSSFFSKPKEEKAEEITVSVARVFQKDVVVNTVATGNVQPYGTVNVKSRVDGQMLSEGFKEGDDVKEKQVLFLIDPRPFQVQIAQAKATLAKDKAQLAIAQLAVKRNQSLLPKQYISRQDFDQLRSNVAALAATVKASEAAVENAELQLSYTTIRSPIAGRAGDVLVQTGNLVKANDTTPLVVINQITPIFVDFKLPENKLEKIRQEHSRSPVPVTATSKNQTPSFSVEGKLTFIDNKIDATTGTIQLKATFPNKDQKLWPGEFVEVKIPIERIQNALLVPTTAVQEGPEGSYVFVVGADSKVSIRPVKIGSEISGNTVIVEGLKLGETVVTEGQLRLVNGTQVKISEGNLNSQ